MAPDFVPGDFVPGLRLAREFYATCARPLLESQFPGLAYAAALLGPGSEVLGFDSQRSTDHDWGPRLQVCLGDSDAGRYAATRAAASPCRTGWRSRRSGWRNSPPGTSFTTGQAS
jgi:hypothetical protein